MLVEFFKTLNLFMAVDSSLGARIAKFQQELKTKRKPKAQTEKNPEEAESPTKTSNKSLPYTAKTDEQQSNYPTESYNERPYSIADSERRPGAPMTEDEIRKLVKYETSAVFKECGRINDVQQAAIKKLMGGQLKATQDMKNKQDE